MRPKTTNGKTVAEFNTPDKTLWDRFLDSIVLFQMCERDGRRKELARVAEENIRAIFTPAPNCEVCDPGGECDKVAAKPEFPDTAIGLVPMTEAPDDG